MAHMLPKLPYPYDALEPHIDAKTMEIHHTKHHQAYADNLNKALEGNSDLQKKSVEQLLKEIGKVPEAIRQAVINNGGGHANHSMFWTIMGPGCGGPPSGEVGEAINSAFGSFEKFQEELAKAAMGRFGSGWAWLVLDGNNLKIISTPNQDNPMMQGLKPVMGIDVWEHAYYLKYQNRRADYIKAWWNVVNWDEINNRFVRMR